MAAEKNWLLHVLKRCLPDCVCRISRVSWKTNSLVTENIEHLPRVHAKISIFINVDERTFTCSISKFNENDEEFGHQNSMQESGELVPKLSATPDLINDVHRGLSKNLHLETRTPDKECCHSTEPKSEVIESEDFEFCYMEKLKEHVGHFAKHWRYAILEEITITARGNTFHQDILENCVSALETAGAKNMSVDWRFGADEMVMERTTPKQTQQVFQLLRFFAAEAEASDLTDYPDLNKCLFNPQSKIVLKGLTTGAPTVLLFIQQILKGAENDGEKMSNFDMSFRAPFDDELIDSFVANVRELADVSVIMRERWRRLEKIILEKSGTAFYMVCRFGAEEIQFSHGSDAAANEQELLDYIESSEFNLDA